MRFRFPLACALLGAACVAAPMTADAEPRSVDYACKGRMTLHVMFNSDNTTAIVESDKLEPQVLPGGQEGEAFLYSSGKYTFRGSGTKASWQVGKMRLIPCWVVPE